MVPSLYPSLVPAIAAAAAVVLVAAALLVVLSIENGPDPGEVAVAYERAWDRLDFELLWVLSAPGMRDGRSRHEFVAAKRETYRQGRDVTGLVQGVRLERLDVVRRRARAVTRLELRDGGVMLNEVRLGRHGGRWAVEGYRLGPQPARP